MSDGVWVSIITGVFLLAATFIANRNTSGNVKRIERTVNAVNEQVSNNHVTPEGKPINLREENDERHKENSARFAKLEEGQSHLVETMEALRSSIVRLWKQQDKTTEQIDEMTQPRSRFQPGAKHRTEEP